MGIEEERKFTVKRYCKQMGKYLKTMWLSTGSKSWLQGEGKCLCWGHKKGTIWSKRTSAGLEQEKCYNPADLIHLQQGRSAVKQSKQQFSSQYLSTLMFQVTTCIHFMCMHTLYLPRKGCLPPLISMSSSRSSMHLTGRPVLLKDTFIRRSLKHTIPTEQDFFLFGEHCLSRVATVS